MMDRPPQPPPQPPILIPKHSIQIVKKGKSELPCPLSLEEALPSQVTYYNYCDFSLTNKISGGAQGFVYEVTLQNGDERRIVAAKSCNGALKEQETRFIREVEFLYKHKGYENIVNIHGVAIKEDRSDALMVMDRMPTSLQSYMKCSRITLPQKIKLATGLVDVLYDFYTWRPAYYHCDIKPSNILVSGEGTSKICDFGELMAVPDPNSERGVPYHSTQVYLSEEIKHTDTFNGKDDTYSAGVVLWELFFEGVPLNGLAHHFVHLQKCLKDKVWPPHYQKIVDTMPKGIGDRLLTMIVRCLTGERVNRMSPIELKQEFTEIKEIIEGHENENLVNMETKG